MTTVNERLRDAAVSHSIHLERYKAGVVRQMLSILDRADADLVALIRRRNVEQPGERLDKLLSAIREMSHTGAQRYTQALRGHLQDLAAYEIDFQSRSLRRLIPDGVVADLGIVAPSTGTVYAAAMARPFAGRLLREWTQSLERAKYIAIRDAVRMGVVEGETVDQIVRRVRGTKARKYRDGIMALPRHQAEAVVRTAVNHTVSTARDKLYQANSDLIKGVQWVSTLDTRTSETCQALDGEIFPVDSGPRPPAHVNCLPAGSLVTTCHRITGASKRWYDGNILVIRTAGGKHLACTPNHPVLTSRGFIPAQLVHEGDHVVRGVLGDGVPLVGDHAQYVPARIEDVAEAFFASQQVVAVPVPMTAKDFHGDVADGDIAIIGADCSLRPDLAAALAQHLRQAPLVSRCLAGLLCFARNNGARSACETMGDSLRAFASAVQLCRDLRRKRCGVRSDLNTQGAQAPENSVCIDPQLARQILGTAPTAVLRDKVVGVECRAFSGHVYNLETESGFYASDGIIVHNCRSTVVPVLKSWRELGIDRDELPPGTRASMNGQVPATQTYGEWLRGQPVSVQNEALGKSRAQLFRNGGLSVDRFSDARGRRYTLAELKSREAAAFERAGL